MYRAAALVVLAVSSLSHASFAHADQASAQAQQEILELKMELMLKVEFPVRRQRLESEIKLAEEQRKHARRRYKDLHKFESKFSTPTKAAFERATLDKMKAEFRLRDLRRERTLLLQHGATEKRLRKLLLQRSAAFEAQFAQP